MTLLELPDEADLRALSSRGLFGTPGGVFERARTRPWSKVTGITLHQTACLLGERAERWLNVGAHYGVTRGGQQFRLHDETDRIVHGHDWNAQCVGIECDGLYAGVEGDIATVWDDPSTKFREQPMKVTGELIAATIATCRRIKARIEAGGGKLRVIVSHRQSSSSRRSDPGEAIWKAVALPLIAEWGLSDGGPGFKLGDGRPNPEAWDPSRTGERY